MQQANVISAESTILLDMASTHTGMFVEDEQQRIVFWNDGAKRVLGFLAHQVVGLCSCQIFGGSGNTQLDTCEYSLGVDVWTQLLAGEVIRHVRTANTCDGLHKEIRFTSMLGHSPNGAPRVLHFIRELTPGLDGVLKSEEARSPKDERAFGLAGTPKVQAPQHLEPLGAAESGGLILHVMTNREHEVLKLLSTGLSNLEIARVLGISPITVRNHVTKVIEKLEVKTRLQAVIVATRRGLL